MPILPFSIIRTYQMHCVNNSICRFEENSNSYYVCQDVNIFIIWWWWRLSFEQPSALNAFFVLLTWPVVKAGSVVIFKIRLSNFFPFLIILSVCRCNLTYLTHEETRNGTKFQKMYFVNWYIIYTWEKE
jgi:hypothetical protein